VRIDSRALIESQGSLFPTNNRIRVINRDFPLSRLALITRDAISDVVRDDFSKSFCPKIRATLSASVNSRISLSEHFQWAINQPSRQEAEPLTRAIRVQGRTIERTEILLAGEVRVRNSPHREKMLAALA